MQDFRLRNTATYEEWYNGPHRAPELQVSTSNLMTLFLFSPSVIDAKAFFHRMGVNTFECLMNLCFVHLILTSVYS